MKIILVLAYMASIGGVTRYVYGMAKYFASQNDQVVIVSLYADRNLFKGEKNITIIDLADKTTLPQSIRFWLNLKKLQKKFADIVSNEKPDVVLFNDFPATMWAQKFRDIPTLCYNYDIHLLYTNTYINSLPRITRWMWRLIRIIIRKYDKKQWNYFNQVICNCHFTSKYIEKTYKKVTNVIYNGTDSKIFSPPENFSKKKSILTLADVQVRRADFLLTAAYKLSKKRRDFKIWIVGNKGQNDTILRNLVHKYNLEDMVEFFGTVYDDSKLAKIYSESLVLAHLVKESSFGGTAAEAMACQTPVIAWKPSGLEELIEDGINGFNIEENNYDVLIEYIEKFLDNPKLSIDMGKKARVRVQSMIERDEKYKQVRDLLQSWISRIN